MNRVLPNLIAMQFREFVREPDVLFWGLVFPIVLSGVLGLAFANRDRVVNTVAVIENQYIASNQPLNRLQQTQPDSLQSAGFNFVRLPAEEAFLRLKRGEVALILEPSANNQVIYHFDPQNEEAKMQHLLLENQLNTPAVAQTIVKPVETQGSRYIDFLIPGMIALGLMNSCVWGIGWNLIELRIKKLLRRMVATPMSKPEFLIAQFVTRLVLSLVEASVLLTFAYFFFDIRIQGSFLTFLIVFFAGSVAFSGIAILVASRPEKTQVGSGVINFITLSMTVLSGIFFSYTNFPEWAVAFIQFLPLTLLADTMRGIFNEGATLIQVAGKAVLLLAYGLISFAAGLRVFKWY